MAEQQTITVEEWLQELRIVSEGNGEGALTVREMSELTGRCVGWTREKVRKGLQDGSIVRTHKQYVGIQGFTIRVPAYRIVGKKKKGMSHGAIKQG